MHLSVVGPVMESPLVPRATKERLAKMVVHEGKLIGGNFSEPTTSGLVGTAIPLARARRVDNGYRITGRKAFASMIGVADFCMVMAYPDESTAPSAAMVLLVPRDATGRRVDKVWDTLGMRATRSDSMTLDECWVSDDALIVRVGRHHSVSPARRELVLGLVHRRSISASPSPRTRRSSRSSARERRPATRSRSRITRTCAATWRR